jgi:hypothetical protein
MNLLLGDGNILAKVKRNATVRCTPVPSELVEHLHRRSSCLERIALVRNITRDSKIKIVDITGRLDRFAQVCYKVWEKKHVLAERFVFLPVAPLQQSIIWDGNREKYFC